MRRTVRVKGGDYAAAAVQAARAVNGNEPDTPQCDAIEYAMYGLGPDADPIPLGNRLGWAIESARRANRGMLERTVTYGPWQPLDDGEGDGA